MLRPVDCLSILYVVDLNLKVHSQKVIVLLEFFQRDFQTFCLLLEVTIENAVVFFNGAAHFHLLSRVNNPHMCY